MLVAMTAMLVSVAELSNILSVLAVLVCFCGMVLFIMRNMTVFWLQGEELMFGGSVHPSAAQPRIPQMKMMKVHIPFTFKLQETSKSSYSDWCSTSQGLGRCRPDFNCFDANKSDESNCTKEEHVCCPEPETPSRMCRKYAESVYSGGDELARSLPKSNSTQTSVCASSHTPLIVGGEKASDKEFPYMAVLGYGKSFETARWMCGGTLISEKFIITAAHCLRSSEEGFVRWARLGNVNLKTESSNEQIFQITKKLVHPKYKLPSFMYDIMLLELDKPAQFTAYVRPACLNVNDTVNRDTAIATGFGKLQHTDQNGTIDLKVSLEINPLDVCQRTYSLSRRQFPKGVHDSVLCAGVLTGGKDTCQGDSGGPLVIAVDDPFCMYSLIGVTSFGLFCGLANSPAIYTRVSYFIPWIVENVWNKPLDDQQNEKNETVK